MNYILSQVHSLSVAYSSSFAQTLVYLLACIGGCLRKANNHCDDQFLSPASTVSSQILLTHLFLALANLASGFLVFLLLLPLLFSRLRLHVLPCCFSNLSHPSDLRVDKRENSIMNFSVFIQSLQLQSSKVSESFSNDLDFPNVSMILKTCDKKYVNNVEDRNNEDYHDEIDSDSARVGNIDKDFHKIIVP